MVLTSSENQAGRIYERAGDEAFTKTQLTTLISKHSKKTIAYISMPNEDFSTLLVQIGLPQGMSNALAESEDYAASSWLENNSKQLSQLT